MRPHRHLDCVRGHGKEVWEGSGRERNLPGTAFEVGVSQRQSQSGQGRAAGNQLGDCIF